MEAYSQMFTAALLVTVSNNISDTPSSGARECAVWNEDMGLHRFDTAHLASVNPRCKCVTRENCEESGTPERKKKTEPTMGCTDHTNELFDV
jgi:hypothetical protein